MSTGINVSGLSKYVEQNRLPLIKKAVLSAKTADLVNLQTDIKSEAALNLVSVSPVLQDGSVCGWTDSGDVKLSQRTIKVAHLKVNQSFCDKKLEDYWMGHMVKTAAVGKELPFEREFSEEIAKNIAMANEKLMWQGDTSASGDATKKWFDGFIKILTDGNAVKPLMTGKTSAYDAVMAVYAAIPAEVIDNAVIFVGSDLFRMFTMELVSKNLYHYDGKAVDGEIMLPGTNTRVVAVNGLNTTDQIVAADPKNLFVGVDMANDAEVFDFFYSRDNREFRLALEYNLGVQIAYLEECVIGKRQAE